MQREEVPFHSGSAAVAEELVGAAAEVLELSVVELVAAELSAVAVVAL